MKRKRDSCGYCGRDVALDAHGAAYAHGATDGRDKPHGDIFVCRGSFMKRFDANLLRNQQQPPTPPGFC